MIIGMMLSGVIAGIAGMLWAIAAALPTIVVIAAYPVVGLMGAILFLTVAVSRGQTHGGFDLSEDAN